ncbi:MAG TPA: BTAD domain-containing putative transcriptional regulator [Actinomycetota bacterium]
MFFEILGPLTVTHDGKTLPISATKEQALLARLLLAEGRPIPVDALIEDLWDGSPPDTAGTALRVHVSKLRRTFEEMCGRRVVETVPRGYRLDVDMRNEVDSGRFVALLAEARAGETRGAHRHASALYAEALGLWRGDAFTGIDLTFARSGAARLNEQRLIAVEEKADVDLALGAHRRVAEELAVECARFPTRETVWARRMLALYRAGRQSDALEAFQELREHLAESLGIDPSAEVSSLFEAILKQSATLDVGGILDTAAPHNLPFPANRFLGREAEQTEVGDLLDQARLVTLTGPGGSGKTRLAIEIAHRMVARYPDGVWLVELAAVDDPSLVIRRIASAVGVREQAGRALQDTLLDELAGRQALLLIDNCEHLLEEVASACATILAACPRMRILTTSRESLRVPGETVTVIAPLPVPPANTRSLEEALEHPAAALFLERARAANAHLDAAAHVGAIVEICRRLDGMPLAIELVAARTRAAGLPDLVANLADTLRLLTVGSRTGDPRHQTMRGTLAWSFDLLNEEERCLFRRLSVFHGGCTTASATLVCAGDGIDAAEVLDLLSGLVDKSLLSMRHTTSASRYEMLVVIRDYAAEQLRASGEADRIADAHLGWVLTVAESTTQKAWMGDAVTVASLAEEHDNITTALERATAGNRRADEAARLAVAISPYFARRGYVRDRRKYLERALDQATTAPLRGRVLTSLASTANDQGEFPRAQGYAEDALDIARAERDEILEMSTLITLGNAMKNQGDYAGSITTFRAALEIAQRIGDEQTEHMAIHNLAPALAEQGDLGGATALIERSLAIARARGDSVAAVGALANLGVIAWRQGETDGADARWTEALEMSEALGDVTYRMTLLGNLGSVDQRRGHMSKALERYEASLELAYAAGAMRHVGNAVVNIGAALYQTGGYVNASVTLERALRMMRESGDTFGAIEPLLVLSACRIAAGDLGAASTHLAEAREASRVAGYVRGGLASAIGMGDVALACGDLDEARTRYAEALEIAARGIDEGLHGTLLRSLTALEMTAGDAVEARAHAVRSVEILLQTEDTFEIARSLTALGVVAASDTPQAAAVALGAARALLERAEGVLPPSERAAFDGASLLVRDAVGEAAFDEAVRRTAEVGAREALVQIMVALGEPLDGS